MKTFSKSSAVIGWMLVLLGWTPVIGQSPDPPPDRPRLITQTGHPGGITSLAFSADGRLVLTGGRTRFLQLWDVASGRQVRRFGGRDLTTGVFSPDGSLILTGSFGRTPRIWHVETGREVRTLRGHEGSVGAVDFSPDGRLCLTAGKDGTIRLWEVGSGREVGRLVGHEGDVGAASFSADGLRVVSGGSDRSVRVWRVATRRQELVLTGHRSGIATAVFSPDGRFIASGAHGDPEARIWSLESGREVGRLAAGRGVVSIDYSPDGRRIVTGASGDGGALLWDAQSRRPVQRLEGGFRLRGLIKAVFSPDGRQVLMACSGDPAAQLWDVDPVERVDSFGGHADLVTAAVFSPGPVPPRLYTGQGGEVRIWDLAGGREVQRLKGHTETVTSLAISPDGTRLVTGSADHTARLWDLVTGRELTRFEGHEKGVLAVALSFDGSRVLTGSDDKTARLWDAASGREIGRFSGHLFAVHGVAFALDDRAVVTGSSDKTARLWDIFSGREIRRFRGHTREVVAVVVSADGRRLATGSWDGTARLWEVDSGREVGRFEGHRGAVSALELDAEGRRLLTAGSDQTARLWDVAGGREIRRFEGHSHTISAARFYSRGDLVLTASRDQTSRLWNAASGEELCRLISFRDGTWAVVDGAGRFDASNGGDVEGLHWVIGLEPIALSQLKARYYDPGLLAKRLGLSDGPLRNVAALARRGLGLHPRVTITHPPEEADPVLRFEVRNRGGGIGAVAVKINGKEITGDARPPGSDDQAPKMDLEVDLAGDPRFLPAADNEIEVVASNAEGYLSGRGVVVEVSLGGATEPTRFWAVVAGVSDYHGSALDLSLASKDAEVFADALQIGAERLFGPGGVHVRRLNDRTRPATRANLLAAFEELAQARAGDILVVYLAGHGVTWGVQDEGDYYYLLQEATTGELRDPAVRRSTAISSRELTELIKGVPALKQVLILDTCSSGRLIQDLSERRDISSSQVLSLERLKDRTGTFILAGSAADAVSYEASRYGQGLLTYSLLMGMKGAALRDQEFVDVSDWFGYSIDQVPRLARGIGGIQQPRLAVPGEAESFDVGRLTTSDRGRIPLAAERPVVIRTNFQHQRRFRDQLGLTARVDQALKLGSDQGAAFVFVDAAEFAGAYLLVGRYLDSAGRLRVALRLFRDDRDAGSFDVEGDPADLDDLTARVVAEVERRLR